MTGKLGGKNAHAARRNAVNDNVDVPSHRKSSFPLRDRQDKCTSFIVSILPSADALGVLSVRYAR